VSVLPTWQRVLVVVAHPDDESFGLGGVIAALVDSGADVRVLCLTAGEASTLGASEHLAQIRADELEAAARELGVHATVLRHHPDGALAARLPQLVQDVAEQVQQARPDGLLVFCAAGGVTGHPDHEAATTAALTVAVRERIPVLGWGLPERVTDVLNAEYSAAFAGHDENSLPIVIAVDRERQRRAIAAHASQAVPGSVLWRRLELLGSLEHLRLVTWREEPDR
jgi:LmbE family N-acetylglucosaminyl deacetylase